jgi:very-short-patch-repair endonuclease
MTSAKEILSDALRDRQLAGLKFRRQVPVGPFVVDFVCLRAKLAVEIDGSIHDEQIEQDEYRSKRITTAGYRLIRFPNEEVTTDLPSVLAAIRAAAIVRLPLSLADGEGEGAGG